MGLSVALVGMGRIGKSASGSASRLLAERRWLASMT